MKAIILAAGKGIRMYPFTENRPKVMINIANKPILYHIIVSIRDAGINEFIIVVGYQSEKIINYFGDGSNMNVKIIYVHQNKSNGTACAINIVHDYVNSRFLVLNGDTIVSSSYIKQLIQSNTNTIVSIAYVMNPLDFGVVHVNRSNGKVLSIIEKAPNPSSNLINAGIYLFSPNIFKAIQETTISKRGEYEITDSIQYLIDTKTEVDYFEIDDKWFSINRPWELLDANEYLLSIINPQIKGIVEPFAIIKGNVSIDTGTLIRSGSYIEGNIIIGNNCDIGPNCYIRTGTSIGDNVHIGNAVEVKNSIIMNRTHIGHLSYIGDSIIGENCNFGAGTIVANLRHDKKTIHIKINDTIVDSGRRKLGVIMGDNVYTSVNTSINPGTLIENNTQI